MEQRSNNVNKIYRKLICQIQIRLFILGFYAKIKFQTFNVNKQKQQKSVKRCKNREWISLKRRIISFVSLFSLY